MEFNKVYLGDALETIKTFPDNSIDCVVTSPPYYALRDYGIDGQIGLEETPEAYTQRLVDLFHEIKRTLKDEGTLWVNIGDSYYGGGGEMQRLMSIAGIFRRGVSGLIAGIACLTSKAGIKTLRIKTLSGFRGCLPLLSVQMDGIYDRILFGTSQIRCQRA